MKSINMLAKSALVALLATAAVSANAADSINAFYNFDNVSSGSTANSALGADVSFMSFANPDYVTDAGYDNSDPNAPSHWVDATAVYGDILVKSDVNAVSGSNVLWNSAAPILLLFTSKVNIQDFSIMKAGSNFGSNSVIFLDVDGHVIPNSETFANASGLISTSTSINNVGGVLITAGGNYDDLHISAYNLAAVPEADSSAMMLLGLTAIGAIARRRKNK